MAIIRPSADLRNKYKEISELCKSSNEPIYLTVNGREDTALLSYNALNELYATIELLTKINRALVDINEGRVTPLSEIKRVFSARSPKGLFTPFMDLPLTAAKITSFCRISSYAVSKSLSKSLEIKAGIWILTGHPDTQGIFRQLRQREASSIATVSV